MDTYHLTVFSVGDYVIDGDAWSGLEWYFLIPTTAGLAEGASECQIVYTMTGTRIRGTGACTDCDIGVATEGTFSEALTTCSDATIAGMFSIDATAPWSTDIALDELGDGTATWHFSTDGSTFGTGPYSTTAGGFASDEMCEFWTW